MKVIHLPSLWQALCFVFEGLMLAGHTSGIRSHAKSLTSKDFQRKHDRVTGPMAECVDTAYLFYPEGGVWIWRKDWGPPQTSLDCIMFIPMLNFAVAVTREV